MESSDESCPSHHEGILLPAVVVLPLSFATTKDVWDIRRLKHDAVRVEVYHTEHLTSDYQGRPLTAMSRDDMLMEQIQ